MNKPLLDPDGLERIGENVRDAIVSNYNASPITNRTGTLRSALTEANIQVQTDGDGATINVAPDQRRRPARPGEANPPSVQEYGPPTFAWAAGRLRGFQPIRAVTFGRGGPTTSAGEQKEILALDASQTENIADDLSDLARKEIIARLSR